VALSVAVLGSILAEFYRGSLSPALSHLPAAARGAASSSITATQAVAQQLGSAGRSILVPANDAFVHAMHATTLVAALMALAGALVVVRWMPGRAGQAAPAAHEAEPIAPAQERDYEAELAIMESDMLKAAEREV